MKKMKRISKAFFDKSPEQQRNFLLSAAAVITILCGNLNKVYEKASSLQLQQATNSSVEHVAHSYGADIIVKDNSGQGFLL